MHTALINARDLSSLFEIREMPSSNALSYTTDALIAQRIWKHSARLPQLLVSCPVYEYYYQWQFYDYSHTQIEERICIYRPTITGTVCIGVMSQLSKMRLEFTVKAFSEYDFNVKDISLATIVEEP